MPRSPLALAALATVAVPGLRPVAARAPHTAGADFDVAGVLDADGGRWIVRAPRSDAAGAAMEGEVALLAALAAARDDGRLAVDVPRPSGFAPLPEHGRAMVYPEILGDELRVDRLGAGPGMSAQVARAIASLHELPVALVADAGLPAYTAEEYRRRRLSELDEAAATGHIPTRLLGRWESALEDVRLWRFSPTPVHGDLAAEHVLVREARVVGIIDWSDARVADPADDLAWLLAAAPEQALDSILEAYALARTEGADEQLLPRAVLASELALVRWLMHGVRVGDDEVVADAVAMLADLDAATAGAAPISGLSRRHADPAQPVQPDEQLGDPDVAAEPAAVPGPKTASEPEALTAEIPVRAGDDTPTTEFELPPASADEPEPEPPAGPQSPA
ncbi:phosphotransferase [Pseudactinotalea sp. HY160]|uniref:phosphotransferase n=1 Tax=Pseudactinotalea sp. HY160 TaxID=2654490 RepID=UPI00128D7937|nr:phosphotransferase [Pseudactinotalea sp. HY160]MPV51083.1 phosphotransferase [Pseudactinotalea sp. HY160]